MIRVGRENDKRTDAAVDATLLREGGVNRFGGPNFRAVWSNSRLEWVKADFEVLHQRPKYEHKPDRWVVERWCGPEKYLGQWIESEMGPFPTYGDYEASLIIESPKTQDFIQLTPSIAREVVRRVLRGEAYSDWARLVALREREARAEREQDRVRHDIFTDDNHLYTGSYVSVL